MKRDLKLVNYVLKQNQKLKKRINTLEEILSEMSNFREILTPEEVCREFSISRKTFDRFRKEGLKTMQPKRNGSIKVKRTEMENFLNSKKRW